MELNVWPAILAYDAYMLGNYGTVKDPIWAVERIGRNASVLHSMDVVNSGSINEFTISMGGNINNILYFGASIGIQSVHKKLGVTYQEWNTLFQHGRHRTRRQRYALAEQLDVMNLYQEMEMNGSGVNFKLGFTARPLTGLRVGVAFHTPTYYSLDYSYRADIFSDIRNNADNKVATVGNATPRANNSGGNSWDFTSPARLMFGASYTFGTFAIVSIDYERDWYNGIRVKNVPQYNYFSEEDYKAEFKHNFQGTNSIRAGVEVKPLPILALRVGGGYTDSMLKERDFYVNDAYTSMPTTYESYYFSAGAGVNLGRNTTLELAYQYVTNKQTQYSSSSAGPKTAATWRRGAVCTTPL
ncbi:MAG: OmpP1/FadL family transporter [Alistipes finegoldii]